MDLKEKAWQIYFRLLEAYGEPDWKPSHTPVDELILTILSANTNDVNSGRAFRAIKAHYGEDWDAVRTAPLEELKEVIRVAGMYNQKAPRIIKTLEMIRAEQGAYNIDHVAQMPVDEALVYLTHFPGVGHKTASIVLLFCFRAHAFPVDTHVQRIAQRLGVTGRKATPEAVKKQWESLLPGETFLALHINQIQHGREVCRARNPRCEVCNQTQHCDYFQRSGEWQGRE